MSDEKFVKWCMYFCCIADCENCDEYEEDCSMLTYIGEDEADAALDRAWD